MLWFAHTANQHQSRDPGTWALKLGCAIHPCDARARARGVCPAPCPSARAGWGPRAHGQAARLPSHTAGLPCPARQLSQPMMDGCRALFCSINNAFGKLKNISAIALNFNLIPSRGLAAAQGSLVCVGNGVCCCPSAPLWVPGLSVLSAKCLRQTEQIPVRDQAQVQPILETGCEMAEGRVILECVAGGPIPGWGRG